MQPTPSSTDSAAAADHDADVLVLNRDLFFGVRLQQVLLAGGWRPRVLPTVDAIATHLGAAGVAPRLIVVDLATAPNWPALMDTASAHELTIPVLAFGAHRDVAALRNAKAGGAARVVSNGDFHADPLRFISRYALPPREPSDDDGRTF